MIFEIKEGRGFYDEGAVYTAPVIARKLNGYKVPARNPEYDGQFAFLCFEDIHVLEISDAEKNMPIEW